MSNVLAEQEFTPNVERLGITQNVLKTIRHPAVVLDERWRILAANGSFAHLCLLQTTAVVGADFLGLAGGFWNQPPLVELLRNVSVRSATPQHVVIVSGQKDTKKSLRVTATVISEISKTLFLAIEEVENKHSGLLARELFESIPECVTILECNGRVLSVNQNACRAIGIDHLEALQQMDWVNLWTADSMFAAKAALSDACAGGIGRFQGHYSIVPDKARWWDVVIAPLAGDSAMAANLICVSRDISDRRQLEFDRERLLLELERSNRELADFAHVASHDLRSPLTSISSYAQLLSRRYADLLDVEANEFLGHITNSAKRMARLLADLLQYAQVTRTHVVPTSAIDLEEVLESCRQDLHKEFSETGTTLTHDRLPNALVQRTSLIQILNNLIGNAIAYRRLGVSPQIHISARREGTRCIYSVSDNGLGIEPEYLSLIFEPFKRLHGLERPGTGLGLAITQKLVERHGGHVWVESRLGEGSTFFFSLPAAQPLGLSAKR